MTKSLSILVLVLTSVMPAQSQVDTYMRAGIPSGDTLRVEVVIGEEGVALPAPVTSFQFSVVGQDSTFLFLGIENLWTLTASEGWTTRANPANGRVGGFSSSLDAFTEGGVLTVLLFRRTGLCKPFSLQLDIFRLNAGNPLHSPEVPGVTLDTCEN
jgi:hypothetical protein